MIVQIERAAVDGQRAICLGEIAFHKLHCAAWTFRERAWSGHKGSNRELHAHLRCSLSAVRIESKVEHAYAYICCVLESPFLPLPIFGLGALSVCSWPNIAIFTSRQAVMWQSSKAAQLANDNGSAVQLPDEPPMLLPHRRHAFGEVISLKVLHVRI